MTQKVLVASLFLVVVAGTARASNYALEEIPQAIPQAEAVKLKLAGIPHTFALLEKAGDAKARKALAQKTQIPEKTIEGWVEMADLMRIRGIGPDVAHLLAAANCHTVAQLKAASAAKLNDDITKANAAKHLSENPPSVEHLTAWISQAQTLPIVLK